MALAYVFWHSRRGDVAAPVYESALERFQSALRSNPPPGFRGSRLFRLSDAPWLPGNLPVYEDWYLLDDSAAMDRLNDAAISGSRQAPHDDAARLAASGTAGLYRLRAGSADVLPKVAYWFAKPAGESYETFFARFRDAGAGFALWGRQMVLGPTPEFCWQSAAVPDWLRKLGGAEMKLETV